MLHLAFPINMSRRNCCQSASKYVRFYAGANTQELHQLLSALLFDSGVSSLFVVKLKDKALPSFQAFTQLTMVPSYGKTSGQ